MFYNNKSIRRILFPVVCLSFLIIQNINAEESKPGHLQIETNRGHVLEGVDSPRAMDLEGERIIIPEQKTLNTPKSFTTGQAEHRQKAKDIEVDKYETAEDKRFKGASIANTSGMIIPASITEIKPKDMKRVQNLGKAQSIKSEVKYSDSVKLLKLEEKRKKRKESFKKRLDKREARKALVNNRRDKK